MGYTQMHGQIQELGLNFHIKVIIHDQFGEATDFFIGLL